MGARILAPLASYDDAHNGDLIRTLRVYFANRENASRTAEALFLHRNGLLYRLGRVEDLLGASLSDRDVALAVQLALRSQD